MSLFLTFPQNIAAQACADPDLTLNAVRALSQSEWTTLDDGNLTALWLLARDLRPFCQDCSTDDEVLTRCCEKCEVCPWLGFRWPDDASSLGAVTVVTCPSPLEEALRQRDTVIDAMVPVGDALSDYSKDNLRVTSFGWRTEGSLRSLRATLLEEDGLWLGHIILRQCPASPTVATFPGKNEAETVRVTEIEVYDFDGPHLAIEYETHCDFSDRRCVELEARAIWPSVQELAEREQVSEVIVSANGCGGGTDVTYRKDEKGVWQGHYVFKP